MPCDRLPDEEHAAQVDLDDPVPVLGRDVEERFAPGDAGVVGEHVDAAQRSGSVGHQPVDVLDLADVADGAADRWVVELAERFSDTFRLVAAQVHSSAFLEKTSRSGQPDAATAPGDEDTLAPKALHGRITARTMSEVPSARAMKTRWESSRETPVDHPRSQSAESATASANSSDR